MASGRLLYLIVLQGLANSKILYFGTWTFHGLYAIRSYNLVSVQLHQKIFRLAFNIHSCIIVVFTVIV